MDTKICTLRSAQLIEIKGLNAVIRDGDNPPEEMSKADIEEYLAWLSSSIAPSSKKSEGTDYNQADGSIDLNNPARAAAISKSCFLNAVLCTIERLYDLDDLSKGFVENRHVNNGWPSGANLNLSSIPIRITFKNAHNGQAVFQKETSDCDFDDKEPNTPKLKSTSEISFTPDEVEERITWLKDIFGVGTENISALHEVKRWNGHEHVRRYEIEKAQKAYDLLLQAQKALTNG